MKKKLIYITLAALTLSGLSACTSYNYYTAAINKTNLSSYHTFAWMPPENTSTNAINNNVADAKIKDATTSSLVSKGLRLSQRNPDLIVTYTLKVGRGARTEYYTPYYGSGFYPGYGWGYRPYYYAYGSPFDYYGGPTYAEKEHFKEGTLIIDLVDTRTRRIVWRGFGVGEVHRNPQKTIDDLPKEVNGVLGQLKLEPSLGRY
jgi:hypothetical protein